MSAERLGRVLPIADPDATRRALPDAPDDLNERAFAAAAWTQDAAHLLRWEAVAHVLERDHLVRRRAENLCEAADHNVHPGLPFRIAGGSKPLWCVSCRHRYALDLDHDRGVGEASNGDSGARGEIFAENLGAQLRHARGMAYV